MAVRTYTAYEHFCISCGNIYFAKKRKEGTTEGIRCLKCYGLTGLLVPLGHTKLEREIVPHGTPLPKKETDPNTN